jgi:predicted kinase
MNQFEEFYFHFTKSSLWTQMLSVREDSPYHRESSVAEHTRMCLTWYKENLSNRRSAEQQLLTRLAILFHDVGKPISKIEKYSEARGTYYSFAGHELASSRLFENYILTDNTLNLSLNEIRKVKWLIVNHLPYDRKDLKNFNVDLFRSLENEICLYTDVLLSDASGRISDTPKIEKVVEWINKNLQKPTEELQEESTKTAYISVGASGSGKSTLANSIQGKEIFSLDDCRIDYFQLYNNTVFQDEKTLYRAAWEYCRDNNDKFNKFTVKVFLELVKRGADIFIDNTNISPKARRQWVTLLRQHEYYIVGFEFMLTLDELKQRSEARLDKHVNFFIVEQQYMALTPLRYGSEVDEIRLIR